MENNKQKIHLFQILAASHAVSIWISLVAFLTFQVFAPSNFVLMVALYFLIWAAVHQIAVFGFGSNLFFSHEPPQPLKTAAERDEEFEIRRKWEKIFWQTLTFGEAVEMEKAGEFFDHNPAVLRMFRFCGREQVKWVFNWYCTAALDFYRARNLDISELPLVEFEQRLYIDNWTEEFFQYWITAYKAREAWRNSFDLLQMAYFYADKQSFESPEVSGDGEKQIEKYQPDEDWASEIGDFKTEEPKNSL